MLDEVNVCRYYLWWRYVDLQLLVQTDLKQWNVQPLWTRQHCPHMDTEEIHNVCMAYDICRFMRDKPH